jgi:hypothetical protein|tara:strand:- start:6158 stop:7405 length:1248 start_codon:yes stop_codon:yes gene_type:complete
MFKKFIKKTFKSIKKVLKNPGRALKKGLGKIGKAFGKLGPIGTLALTLMMPGLGAAWGTFGTWAQGLSGPLGAVMNGIRVAGNAVGSVYGKVTDLVSGTLNKVTGGSFARPGTTGYVEGASDKLSNFVGRKLDDFRMKVGLPTANITPDTAMADATKLGEDLQTKGYTDNITKEQNVALGDGKVDLKADSSLLRKSTTAITTPDPLRAKDLNVSFSPGDIPKPNFDLVKSQGQTVEVVTGFDKEISYIGDNDIEIVKLNPQTTTVAKGTLTDDQIYQNKRLMNYQRNLDRTNQGYTDLVNDNPAATQFDVLRNQTMQLAKFTGGAAAVDGTMSADPAAAVSSQPIEVTPLSTDVTSSNDYTKAYGAQFADAGFAGPQTMQGFADAGFYGGDPFSFGQVLKANSVAVPQSTIRMGV